MYSNAYPTPAATAGGLGSLFAGGFLFTLLVIGIIVLAETLFFYWIVKTAVRNGVVEAIKRTGLDDRNPTYVQGYPPPQDQGGPPAPSSQYGGYR